MCVLEISTKFIFHVHTISSYVKRKTSLFSSNSWHSCLNVIINNIFRIFAIQTTTPQKSRMITIHQRKYYQQQNRRLLIRLIKGTLQTFSKTLNHFSKSLQINTEFLCHFQGTAKCQNMFMPMSSPNKISYLLFLYNATLIPEANR